MGRPWLWVGVALLALVCTGCGANSKESSGSAAMNNAAPPQGAAKVAPQRQNQAQGNAPAAQSAGQPPAQDRQLIRTATVDLRSDDVMRAVLQVKDKARAAGGFAGQENTTENYGSVTVRVPANELDGLIKGLEQVGEVTRSEVRSEDVTDRLVDAESRIATQKASVDRMRVLFERAATTAEIAQIEGELTKRQSELESLQRRMESLKGKVAMSTLTVQVSDKPIAAPVQEKRVGFGGAFLNGWDALVAGLGRLLVVLGAILPFVLVLGVPVAALVVWLRRRRRVTRTMPAAS